MFAFVLLLFSFVPNGNFICFKEYNRLCEILIDNDIQCHLVSNRIKTFNSACRKLANIPSHSKNIYNLHDLIGFRFVFYDKDSLLKFYHHNKQQSLVVYTHDYINNPKDNGYKAFHFHYKCDYDPIKRIECQLFVIEDYYDSIHGNSSNYKTYVF